MTFTGSHWQKQTRTSPLKPVHAVLTKWCGIAHLRKDPPQKKTNPPSSAQDVLYIRTIDSHHRGQWAVS